jgi:hypothetical protein
VDLIFGSLMDQLTGYPETCFCKGVKISSRQFKRTP